MSNKLKFLFTVNDVNHRVFVDVNGTADNVSFQHFESVIRRCYQSFVPFLDKNNYTLEIFDKDFEEYVKLDENEPIEDKSKLRAKPINLSTLHTNEPSVIAINQAIKAGLEEILVESKRDMKDEAMKPELKQVDVSRNGLSQPQPAMRKTIQKSKGNQELTIHSVCATQNINSETNVNDNDCENILLKMNPFFQKLSLNSCSNHVNAQNIPESSNIKSNVSKSLPQLSKTQKKQLKQGSNDSSSLRSSVEFESFEECVLKIDGKKKILKSNFKVNDFENKCELVNVIVEKSQFTKQRVIENNSPFWKGVCKALEKKGIQYKCAKCRDMFFGLLGQYRNILKNLKEYTSNEAQNLWPFFDVFHKVLNLSLFNPDIGDLQKAFDTSEKTFGVALSDLQYPPITSVDSPCSCCEEILSDEPMSYLLDENERKMGMEMMKTDMNFNSISRLIKAVTDNVNDLKVDKLTEEEFWQKIAYQLSAFRNPVDEESKDYWKVTFYTLLKQFLWQEPGSLLPCDVVAKLFEPLEIEIFMNTNDKEMSSLLAASQMAPSELVSDVCEEPVNNPEIDDETLQFQQLFMTCVRKCLKFIVSENEEKRRKYWQKVHQKLLKKGYEVASVDCLPLYLNEFIAIYYKALQSCSSLEEISNRWPIFPSLHIIDLSPFVDDCDYYKFLKSSLD